MTSMALRSVALGEQLADLLRGRIVRGEIAPGTHLVEDTLANDHQISRGPVRDALRILTAEGLLESRRRGFYAKPFSQADVDEIYQLRSAAEHLACKLAIERTSGKAWDDARRHLEHMRRHAEAGDRHAYAHADLEFHSEFYALSGNSRLLALWLQYEPIFATLLDITNAQDSDLGPSFADHTKLMDLAESGDKDQFALVLEEHLSGSHRRLSSAVSHQH